tara:strand:+ start:92 stop:358 length:267 start_codon:yes stop_codon:yes gene_type:complete
MFQLQLIPLFFVKFFSPDLDGHLQLLLIHYCRSKYTFTTKKEDIPKWEILYQKKDIQQKANQLKLTIYVSVLIMGSNIYLPHGPIKEV